MALQARVRRIEQRIIGVGNIPREDLYPVLIDDGTIDVEVEAEAIEKRFEEKYGNAEGRLLVIIVKQFC